MALPALTVRIDWDDNGDFSGSMDDVSADVFSKDHPLSWTRGRSADFSAEATGAASFVLRNDLERYTPDRNWHDNPSFEGGTTGWSTVAVASLTAAATSVSQVTDNAPSAGAKAGAAVLTATVNSGVTYPIPYRFRSGVTYAASVYLKSTAGNLNVRAGLASSGTPADIANSGTNITTSWAQYTFTWTPSADRLDGVFFVRTTTAATATVRIDAVAVNPGTVNAYIEGPTKGQLVPGKPVHIYATYSATDYPEFFGYIERLTPDPVNRTVAITCYDPLRRLQETDVVVPANDFISRSARDFRREVLEDFERGTRNLLTNPSFETNTAGWAAVNGTITRITTDGASGTCAGQFAWTTGVATLDNRIRQVPVFFANQVYRFAVYLKVATGTLAATIGIGEDSGLTTFTSRVVTATTDWQRFTITYTAPTTRSGNTLFGLRPFITIASGTLLVDAASFTRGQALHPYEDTGSGRLPNWVGNGSFDGGALNGWYDGWTNMVGNPSFETNTTGWSIASDAFHTAASSITRVASAPAFGTARADVLIGGSGQGVHYVITGTFVAGVTYRASVYVKGPGTGETGRVGIGSQGTPADFVSETAVPVTGTYVRRSVSWTPASNRTDAHLFFEVVAGSGTFAFDGAAVFRRDAAAVSDPAYADTGPGGGGTFVTARSLSSVAQYGSLSQQADTPATASAGRVYDFNHLGPYFVSGQAYTASVWIRPTSSMPYKVGLSANKGDGTFDEASTTGTLTANVWTQVTLTWTPSGDRTSGQPFDVVLYVYQTDATARTFLIDGVRVIPGSSADDFEMDQWNLAAEPDVYLPTATLSGSALASLTRLNALTLSRHWIEPQMTSPFYSYRTSSRDDLALLTSSETYDDDLVDMSNADIDRASIVNIVPVAFAGGTEFYSDEDSVERYGPHPASAIGDASFYPDRTIPDTVGPALVARYRDPRARPVIRVENREPSILQRELQDLITINFVRLRITGGMYLLLRLEVSVSAGANLWSEVLALEEHSV